MSRASIRWFPWVVPIVIVACMMALTTRTAFGWTHALNHFDINNSDYACGYSSSIPCLYWPEPNHVSAVLYASYDPSLSSVGPNRYNFNTPLSNALGYWNAIQGAFNPLIYNCNYSGCADVVHYRTADLGTTVWAATSVSDYGDLHYSGGQYWAILNTATTTFNTEVSWNNSLQYGSLQADGREVAAHETGHVEALGHTNHTAIMHSGAQNFYTPQADDINAMQSIYTGTIPA